MHKHRAGNRSDKGQAMSKQLSDGQLPIGLPDDIPTLKHMIASEIALAQDKVNLRIMQRKLKRLEKAL